ncbi:MAG: methionine--tRNA ligase [Flavobacteriales bacterium]|nr:MAG: methionine--tRNA ligase [Flavobacteriales bacterium]
MKEAKRHTITAALPYANGPLHLGHIAGCYLPADIYSRYLKGKGKDVLFVCGSDEHGAAITLRAKKEDTTPQEIVDKNHAIIEKAFNDFGIEFDIYHRTSSEIHHETASEFFKDMHQKGAFIEKTTEQFYDEENKQFLADRYIVGTCPTCSFDGAFGDQCEKCGSTLSPTELINPTSTISGNVPILKETTHWFLPMNDHEKWLKEWIETGKLDGVQQHDASTWRKQVIGQCKSWIDNGLLPRSITRDLDWGIKVPVKGGEGKVLYVWFDAPIGYISASKQWAKDNNKNWEDYWKNDDTELVHFIGKDNIVFHAIIFPIILKSHGDYILPTNVPANEFLNLEGDKISTSRNWAVWLHEYLEDFPNKEDELRYVLTSIAPETKDSEFTWKDYQTRVNSELVAIFGNFVNRSVVLTHKYYNGKVPAQGSLTDYDKEVLAAIESTKLKVDELLASYKFRDAQTEAMTLARLGNKYLADTEPWKLIKTDEERVKTIMNIALQLSNALSEIFIPFLPNTSQKLKSMLNSNGLTILPENHEINKAELLYQKIEDAAIETQIEKLKATAVNQSNPKAKPMKDEITFDEFTKMDIRISTILTAEKHPDADKLLKMTVDTGIDERTIVSGIAEHYKPEDVIGKQVSVLINLAPRKIRGIESQGMILMAENNAGDLAFVAPEKVIDNGGEVR